MLNLDGSRETRTVGNSQNLSKKIQVKKYENRRWRVVRFSRDGGKTSSSFLFNSFSALNCIRMARNFAKVFLELVLKELSFK